MERLAKSSQGGTPKGANNCGGGTAPKVKKGK